MVSSLRNYPESEGRLDALQPALDSLAKNAILAYDALQSKAAGFGDEPDSSCPVHGEDFELGGNIIGRYIHVELGERHKLDLYHSHGKSFLYSWQFRLTQPAANALSTTCTKVTKFPADLAAGHAAMLDICVDRHTYPAIIGENGQHAGRFCHPEDNYLDAEIHIAAFKKEIVQAKKRFGA